MPHSAYRPDLMGRAEVTPTGAFVAGSFASFTVTYTCGRFGIDDSGAIKLVFRSANDQTPLQLDDPAAPGYTTVEASNGAVLAVRWDARANIRPWFKELFVEVRRGFMREGDTLTIRLGDPRGGSPGVRLQTFAESTFEFRVLVDAFATRDFVELPAQPEVAIVAGEPVCWRAVLPTLRRPGEDFRLSIKAEDVWGNPSDRADAILRLRPSVPVAGLLETAALRPGKRALVIEGLRVDAVADLVVEVLDEGGGVLCVSNPLRLVEKPWRHYWSDLHAQTEETIGTNSAADYFAFARDLAFVDIAGHQGNDFQITSAFWSELNRLTAAYDEPGRFVTLPGYEWSGNTALGGDHNVWYRTEGRPIYRSSHALVADLSDEASDVHTAHDLFRVLRDEDAIVVAHCGGRYADVRYAHDGRIEPSVEVHSTWGTFEWIVRDALEEGYRVGIVAASDGHKGRPGAEYPGAAKFGAYTGLTCHLMPELTREALFESFRRRNHFATTGARLYLEAGARFDRPSTLYHRNPDLGATESWPVRQAVMGDIVGVDGEAATFVVNVLGAAAIERIELRDGLDLIEVYRPYGPGDLGRRVRVVWEGAEYRGRGRTVTWDGEAHIAGNRVRDARAFNFWNAEKRLERSEPGRLTWQSVTTGSFAGFDLILDDRDAGTLRIITEQVTAELPIAEIGYEDRVWECGGLGKRLRVFRLPDVNPHREVRLERHLALRPEGDTRPYVCVTQEDGHQAWSSPLYLFREPS